jgi:transposase
MYIKRSKLTKKQWLKLTKHFVAGTTARTAAEILGVNKNIAQIFFHRLRRIDFGKSNTRIHF